jgi:hypothetical protein
MIRIALPFALVLLAGCARSEEASFSPVGNETGGPVVAAPVAEDEEDEIALGDWRAGLQGDQQILEFGPAGAAPSFSLGCDSRRNILMQRHGVGTAGDLPVMLVTVGSETKRLAVTNTGGTIPLLRATLPGSDPFRRVLADATLPIIVRIGDSPPLILPPSPMVGVYAAGCATGENQRGAPANASADAAAEPGNAAAPAE